MSFIKTSRVFSPVVIFHENSNHHKQHEAKIDVYKEKIVKMMERNAKLWASKDDFMLNNEHDLNVSPSTSTTSTTSTSSCDSIETIDHPNQYSETYHHDHTKLHYSPPSSAFQPVDDHYHHYTPYEKRASSSLSLATDIYLSKTTSTALTLSSPPSTPPSLVSPISPTSTLSSSTTSTNTTTATSTQKKRRRGNLPKDVTEFLKQWLVQHKKHPYPSEKEKMELAHRTGLTVNQISNWFINARRRILQPMLESEGLQANLLSYNNHHYPSSSNNNNNSNNHTNTNNDHPMNRKPSLNTVDQKKRRQLDIYTYQGFHESYQDDTRKWAFRRTKLPNYEMEDHYAVATR
ncbi:unnamed protein product [Cunninghamella blakesleeana]